MQVEEGQERIVIAGGDEIGPAVFIEVADGQALCVTRRDQSAAPCRQGLKGSVAIAQEQEPEAAVETPDPPCRTAGISVVERPLRGRLFQPGRGVFIVDRNT